MEEQKFLKTRSGDRKSDNEASTSRRGGIIDTARLGFAPQKLDKSTLSSDAARDEWMKELASDAIWRNTSVQNKGSEGHGDSLQAREQEYSSQREEVDQPIKDIWIKDLEIEQILDEWYKARTESRNIQNENFRPVKL